MIVTFFLWTVGGEPKGEWEDCRVWHCEIATGRTEETGKVGVGEQRALSRALDRVRR